MCAAVLAGCDDRRKPAAPPAQPQPQSWVQDLDNNTIAAFIEHGVSLVEFYSPDCDGCKLQRRMTEGAAGQLKDEVKSGRIPVDSATPLSINVPLRGHPTIIVFRDGRAVKQLQGVTGIRPIVSAIRAIQPLPESAVVHHVVICWLKQPGDEAARKKLVEASRELADIPGVAAVKAGRVLPANRPVSDSSFDVAVVMSFRDKQGLESYLRHPAHLKATEEILAPLTSRIVIYDFSE